MKKILASNFIPKQYLLDKYKKRDKDNRTIMIVIITVSIIMFPKTLSIISSMNNQKKQVNNISVPVLLQSYDLNDKISICNKNISGQFNLEESTLFINESELKGLCNNSSISVEQIECISDDKYKIRVSFEE